MPRITIRTRETTKGEVRCLLRAMAESFDPEEGLQEIIAGLVAYETEYGTSTVEFYPQIVAGNLGDSKDAMRWGSLFGAYVELAQPPAPRHGK